MLSLLWVVFFCLLLAILKLSLLLPQWDIFLIFCFTFSIPLVRCFLFSVFTSTTPFHSEIDKLVKSEKLIGFKAVRYSILKELHFRLCLTSLRLSLNKCKRKCICQRQRRHWECLWGVWTGNSPSCDELSASRYF